MAGDVGGGRQLGGGHDGVAAVDGEQAFVEGPVAEVAEGDAVAGIIVCDVHRLLTRQGTMWAAATAVWPSAVSMRMPQRAQRWS